MAVFSIKNKTYSRSLLVGNSAFIPPTVTGGTLTSDSTYYYRTFTSSGTLGVSGGSLTADILVVSGGGGGNLNGRIGAGGGGGALLYTEALSFSSNQTVTVGAGGAATGDSNGGNGSDSSIGSYSASVSNGAVFDNYSGNGGVSKKVISGTTTNYTGGAYGTYGGGLRYGGPGASAAANGVGANPPVGANGNNSYASWASVTGTGANSGYYAGGGAGGYEYNGTIAKISGGLGGGGNGGAGTTNYNADAGTANTGGGGGGCGGMGGVIGGSSAAGGSGIVIVRYTRAQVGG